MPLPESSKVVVLSTGTCRLALVPLITKVPLASLGFETVPAMSSTIVLPTRGSTIMVPESTVTTTLAV